MSFQTGSDISVIIRENCPQAGRQLRKRITEGSFGIGYLNRIQMDYLQNMHSFMECQDLSGEVFGRRQESRISRGCLRYRTKRYTGKSVYELKVVPR